MNWLKPENPMIYNCEEAFEKNGTIDWPQKNIYSVGDIVYLYSSGKEKRIRFKTRVKATDIKEEDVVDDKEFWIDFEAYSNETWSGKYFKLELIAKIDTNNLTFTNLKKHGLEGNLQGAIRLQKEDLLSYIEKTFSIENYNNYPDEIKKSERYREGIKKRIFVNSYERDNSARKKCLEIRGLNCEVCHINFEKLYGSIGIGFIHVHHLKPLSEIGSNYSVDPKTDLVPVCPNCHAMLHRNKQVLTIEELKKYLQNK